MDFSANTPTERGFNKEDKEQEEEEDQEEDGMRTPQAVKEAINYCTM